MRLFFKYLFNPISYFTQIRVITKYDRWGNARYEIWRGNRQYDCSYGRPDYKGKAQEPTINAWEDRSPCGTSVEESLPMIVTHAVESWKLVEERNRKRKQKASVQFLPNV